MHGLLAMLHPFDSALVISGRRVDDLQFYVISNSISTMKGCVQWSPVYDWKKTLQAGLEPVITTAAGQCLTHRGSYIQAPGRVAQS